MTEMLQCPTCRENPESGLTDHPLTLDPGAKGYRCPAGHVFTLDRVAAMLPETDSALKIVKRPQGRPRKVSSEIEDKTPRIASPEKDKTGVRIHIDTTENTPDPLPEKCNDVIVFPEKPEKMANGDLVLPIRIREQYIECFREEAGVQNQSLETFIQERIDWWMENDLVPPAPIA